MTSGRPHPTVTRFFASRTTFGCKKGEVAALQKLPAKRFGPVSTELTARVDAASLAQLEVWFDRAIDASSLEAVFCDARAF